jgi:glycosyltransferase involved in cell wall biosynthesis
MIEAMACGTPVLAFRNGSVPEIVEDGVTGQIVDSEEEAVKVLPSLLSIDRRAVRRRFEERFSASRMAKSYLSVYRSMLRQPAMPRAAAMGRRNGASAYEESMN